MPKVFLKDHKDFELDKYQLSEKKLLKYARQVSRIREQIMQKAEQFAEARDKVGANQAVKDLANDTLYQRYRRGAKPII